MSLPSIAPPMAGDGTCNCIKEMDDRMREKNKRILVTFGLPRDGSPMFVRPLVATEKIETRKRGGACLAIPTYCPFCGVRYEPEPVRPAA